MIRRLVAALLLPAACSSVPPGADDPRFQFPGASAIAEKDLRILVASDLRRWLEQPRPAPLQDAVFRMVSAYSLEGRPGTQIDVEETPDLVVFRIQEAPRRLLGRVRFSGNRRIRDDELEEIEPGALPGQEIPFSERLVARMRVALLGLYRSRGHLDVRIRFTSAAEGDRMQVSFQIEEGPEYVLRAVDGLPPGLRKVVDDLLQRPYAAGTEELIESRVIDAWREQGRPYPRAKATALFDRESGDVRVTVEAGEGPAAVLGEIEVKGEGRTRDGFVRDRAGLEAGVEYQASKLAEAERRLMSTGLFQSARLEPGEVRDGRVPVLAIVEEREPGEVALRAGYGTLDGERIGADVSYDNLFGGAEFVRLGGTLGRFGRRADAEAALRYFQGTDFRPGVAGFYEVREYPSFRAVSYGGEVSLAYDFGGGVLATTGLLHSVIHTRDVEVGVPPGDLLDFEYTAAFASASWDARDVPHLPTRGTFLGGRVEWSDRPLETELRFMKVEGRAAVYLPLPWDLVAAAGIQGGRIRPIDETVEIPIALRYFAGGISTVRGFEFASIGPVVDGEATGGEVYVGLQSELRFPIWAGLHGAVFSDRGAVWFEAKDVDADELRWSVGAGLRYYTPAGALVTDVGWNPSREEGESAVELHLSIGFPF